MKNKLSDLNNHLFAQLERLSDEDLKPERVALEIKRSDAIIGVAEQIISNASLHLRGVEIVAKHGDRFRNSLPMIEGKNEG